MQWLRATSMKGYKTYPRPNNVLRYLRTIGCLRARHNRASIDVYINRTPFQWRAEFVAYRQRRSRRNNWRNCRPTHLVFCTSANAVCGFGEPPGVKWRIVRPFLVSPALELARSGPKPGRTDLGARSRLSDRGYFGNTKATHRQGFVVQGAR